MSVRTWIARRRWVAVGVAAAAVVSAAGWAVSEADRPPVPVVPADPPPGAVPGSLAVTVTGATGTGSLVIALFQTPTGFPDDDTKAWQVATVPAAAPAHTFADVPAGSYAVAVYQDRNGNGKLDKAPPFGIPREPIGISNHPTLGVRARPNFEKGLVAVSGPTAVAVNLVEIFP